MADDIPISRRKIIRLLGTSGTLTAFAGLSASNVAAADDEQKDSEEEDEKSFNVTKTDLKTEDKAQISSTSDSPIHPLISELVTFMENKTGLMGHEDSNIYLDVETDNTEANNYDPRVSVIPFGVDSTESKEKGNSPDTSRSGFLFVFTVVEDDERVPVGTYGITAVGLPSGKLKKRTFGLEDGSPAQFLNEKVAKPTPDSSEDGITTQETLQCAACKTAAKAICAAGGRTAGQYICVGACSLAFGANFIAIFGCATICSALATAISTVGCNAGAGGICVYAQNNSPVDFNC